MADKIKFDKRNFRKHNDRNKKLIEKSLTECGAGRSVLLDADNSLIAGNGVYEQAQRLGFPVRIIETDGTELIAVKRTDIGEEDEKRRKLALADNATSDSSEWDVEALGELDPLELDEWGVLIAPEGVDVDGYGEDFQLPDGEKEPFQQMSFVLADNQAEEVKAALEEAKQLEGYKAMVTFGNSNSNGNALAYIVEEWIASRR